MIYSRQKTSFLFCLFNLSVEMIFLAKNVWRMFWLQEPLSIYFTKHLPGVCHEGSSNQPKFTEEVRELPIKVFLLWKMKLCRNFWHSSSNPKLFRKLFLPKSRETINLLLKLGTLISKCLKNEGESLLELKPRAKVQFFPSLLMSDPWRSSLIDFAYQNSICSPEKSSHNCDSIKSRDR